MVNDIDFHRIVEGLPELATAMQVAELLHTSRRTLSRWSAAGRINVLKSSSGNTGRILIPRSEVLRLLADLAEQAGPREPGIIVNGQTRIDKA